LGIHILAQKCFIISTTSQLLLLGVLKVQNNSIMQRAVNYIADHVPTFLQPAARVLAGITVLGSAAQANPSHSFDSLDLSADARVRDSDSEFRGSAVVPVYGSSDDNLLFGQIGAGSRTYDEGGSQQNLLGNVTLRHRTQESGTFGISGAAESVDGLVGGGVTADWQLGTPVWLGGAKADLYFPIGSAESTTTTTPTSMTVQEKGYMQGFDVEGRIGRILGNANVSGVAGYVSFTSDFDGSKPMRTAYAGAEAVKMFDGNNLFDKFFSAGVYVYSDPEAFDSSFMVTISGGIYFGGGQATDGLRTPINRRPQIESVENITTIVPAPSRQSSKTKTAPASSDSDDTTTTTDQNFPPGPGDSDNSNNSGPSGSSSSGPSDSGSGPSGSSSSGPSGSSSGPGVGGS